MLDKLFARRLRLAALFLGAASLGACVDRPGLLDPDGGAVEVPEDAPRIVFEEAADSFSLYEGDEVRMRLGAGNSARFSATLLLLNAKRDVLWRSPKEVADVSGVFRFTLNDLPLSFPRGERLLVSASVEDAHGRRYYATAADSVAKATIAKAVTRPAVVYQGRVLRVPDGRLSALTAAPDLGRVFYANRAQGTIGSIDLSSPTLFAEVARVGSEPTALDYRSGVLAALMSGGAEVTLLNATASSVRERYRALIPAFFVRTVVSRGDQDPEVRETAVRPYAEGVHLACRGNGSGGCADLRAFGASRTEGASVGGGVLRHFDVSATTDVVSPGVFPEFQWPIIQASGSADTTVAQVYAVSGAPNTGASMVLGRQEYGTQCFSLALGAGVVAASPVPDGPVFVAQRGASLLCGGGTRIVRVDSAWTADPKLSVVAMRNLLGENRIGPVDQILVSDDGTRLLVQGRDEVYVLDEWLRVRGRLALKGVRSVAWLKDASSPRSDRFAVADERGLAVYEPERLTLVGRVEVGPTEPGLLAFVRDARLSDLVVVAGLKDGLGAVVARVPSF